MSKDCIRHNLKILLSGFLHALKGTLAMAFVAGAVVLFCCTARNDGYMAVGDFFAAVCCLALGLGLFYSCGLNVKRKGAFLK